MFHGRFDYFWTLKKLHLNPNKNESKQNAIFFILMNFNWCNKKFEIFPKQTDAILFPFLIFPGKSLISCYGASVLNESSERVNNLLLSLLFEELLKKILRIVFKFSGVISSTS